MTDKIPVGWEKKKLGEVCEIIGGGTPKTSVPEYWNGDIPWLSVVDFNNDYRYVHKTEKTITNEGLKNSSTKMLNASDIIISARGTVGAIAQLAKPMAFNQSCYGLRHKSENTNDYIYYLLKHNVELLRNNTHGSVFDTITRDTFDNIEISLPPLSEQKVIADVLGALDDKIEANNRQNKTLEAMAQALFKSWFVDFDPVKAKTEGKQPEGLSQEIADLFPSSFVDSPLGKIPSGWEVKKIGEFVPFAYGKGLLEKDRNFGTVPIYGSNGIIGYNNKSYVNSAGIIVGRKGTVGTINISVEPFWPIDTTFYIENEPQKRNLRFTYYLLKTVKFDNSDSAVPGLNRNNAHSKALPIPPLPVQIVFGGILSGIHNKILLNSKQSQTLSAIRDSLLPRLIGGKIRVKVMPVDVGDV
jgi:type I restriction enzyme S subunit